MRGLFACLKKDLRLFFGRSGAVLLLLCLLLFPVLSLSLGDTAAARAYVRPFPVAVRDEDGTIMSRTLVSQLREVELFSDVLDAAALPDDVLFSMGAAGVVTIPRDLFYDLYTMTEQPIAVALNPAMPLENALLVSLIDAVAEIIEADRASSLAVYSLVQDGTLTNDDYADMASRILRDALGRRLLFEDSSTGMADTADAAVLFLFCSASQIICMLVCLAVLRTLPDELGLGVLPRFRAAGGGLAALLLSKFLAALVLYGVSWFALAAAVRPPGGFRLAPVFLVTFAGFFALFMLLCAACGMGERSLLYGNLAALFSFVFGGAVYPVQLLPGWARMLSRLTIPYHTLTAAGVAASGMSLPAALWRMWPAALMAVVFAGCALPLWKRRARA